MAKKTTKKRKKEALHLEMINQMIALSTSGFGLVAALAWNNVIQEAVNAYVKKFLPNGSGLISLTIYAIVVTILAVTVTYQLTQIKDRIGGIHKKE